MNIKGYRTNLEGGSKREVFTSQLGFSLHPLSPTSVEQGGQS